MRKAVLTAEPEITSLDPSAASVVRVATPFSVRVRDYLELTKPRIAVMALFTVAIGYLMAAGNDVEPLVLLHTLIGAGLVAAGGSALNQCLEREIDSRMRRTASRPLPAGRLHPDEACGFGILLGTVGYMAPEQVRGERADARSDLFALGVVLHETLAGENPFRRDSVIESLNAILKEEAPEIASTPSASNAAQIGRAHV